MATATTVKSSAIPMNKSEVVSGNPEMMFAVDENAIKKWVIVDKFNKNNSNKWSI